MKDEMKITIQDCMNLQVKGYSVIIRGGKVVALQKGTIIGYIGGNKGRRI